MGPSGPELVRILLHDQGMSHEQARVLVVCYSRSGHTKELGRAIAGAAGWDFEEIKELRSRSGFVGYLRSGWEATYRKQTKIVSTLRDPGNYDLVVVGTPVWNASVSSPIRTWLARHRGRFKNVAFFCTYGGRGAKRVFEQMTELADRQPLATLDLTDRDLARGELLSRVGRFVTAIDHVLRRHPPSESPRVL